MFNDASPEEIQEVMEKAWEAFHIYRQFPLKRRAEFMRAIATQLEECGDELIFTAIRETNLPEARLRGERSRTILQLNSYAAACEEGSWMDIRIDKARPNKNPPSPDLRKMAIPLGPVVVFGASNFPFAYSTAGGDTACALAAGCPVIVKAHPAHAGTSEIVAGAILHAAELTGMPKGVFAHVHGFSTEVGQALVTHPFTKAVGFTGSYLGGKQLFEWGNQRKEPIPVFAEMGSINPIFLLPDKLRTAGKDLATMIAGSVTLNVGQFCTNPGLLIAIDSPELEEFIGQLKAAVTSVDPGTMLHPGIFKNYVENRANAIAQEGVEVLAISEKTAQLNQGMPTIATVSATIFLANPVLHLEVFGPYSLIVLCSDAREMETIAKKLEGQLTASLMATTRDIDEHSSLAETLKYICGRFVLNGVPTGVEVCWSMQHGGPYPATTDSRFTSVGPDGIKRFARPIAYQNWDNELLPDELKNENPLGIWRMVNNAMTRDPV